MTKVEPLSGWRIKTFSTTSGWSWDVPRVKFLTLQGEEYPMSQCEVITSADCCRGYEGVNAFRDNGAWWGGRKKNGIFFIGLQCRVPVMDVVKVTILQGADSRSAHTASDIWVEKLVPGSQDWQHVAARSYVGINEAVTLFDEFGPRRLSNSSLILV
jgi:hypothetical protein